MSVQQRSAVTCFTDANGLEVDEGGEYSYFERDSDDDVDPKGDGKEVSSTPGEGSTGEEDDEAKSMEFQKQTEMLMQKRAREEEDVDLVGGVKRKKATGAHKSGQISMSFDLSSRGARS